MWITDISKYVSECTQSSSIEKWAPNTCPLLWFILNHTANGLQLTRNVLLDHCLMKRLLPMSLRQTLTFYKTITFLLLEKSATLFNKKCNYWCLFIGWLLPYSKVQHFFILVESNFKYVTSSISFLTEKRKLSVRPYWSTAQNQHCERGT